MADRRAATSRCFGVAFEIRSARTTRPVRSPQACDGRTGGHVVAGRPSKVWQPPPGWPKPPEEWSPWSAWRPPEDWPQPPPGWQWWRRTRAGRIRLIVGWTAPVLVLFAALGLALATGGFHVQSASGTGHGCFVSGGPDWLFGVMLGAGMVSLVYVFVWVFLLSMQSRALPPASPRCLWVGPMATCSADAPLLRPDRVQYRVRPLHGGQQSPATAGLCSRLGHGVRRGSAGDRDPGVPTRSVCAAGYVLGLDSCLDHRSSRGRGLIDRNDHPGPFLLKSRARP
jgi:hypothetical protein